MKICMITLVILLMGISNILGQNTRQINFGNSTVMFDYLENKCDTLIFINLHSNEQTSIAAIKQIMLQSHGKYYGIQSGGTRELTIQLKGKTITVDPNRIFTKTGIEKTLKNYKCYSASNLKLVDAFASQLLKELSHAKLLVAVHNSTDGGFSIKSFVKTNAEKQDAKEIYINPIYDEDDFYLVTNKSKFDYFKSKGYNVILQDNLNVEDDGSLSVYCGKNNIDYINIECQAGHLKMQIQMIEEIYKGFVNLNK